jgi:putative transposase
MSERSLRLSLPIATPSTASAVIKGTRKIRVFPKNESYLLELIRQQRRAYNLAVACFRESDAHPELRKSEEMKKTVLRGIIREFVRDEVVDRGGDFVSAGCDEAVLNAFRTRDAVIGRRKKGEAANLAFRSIKDVRQGFLIQKLSPSFVLKNFDVSESLPKEAFKKLTRIVHERGRWFICAQKHITTARNTETQGLRVVAIDPGVRSFATAYTDDHCTTYGDGFYASKVFPLLLEIDKLIGLRARSRNDQWKRHYQKRIDQKVNRAKDLITDLHKRVAFDLVSQFDVILLPSFDTKEMASKVGRKIRTKTVRSMLGLAHYRFELHLKWMCKKHGKRLVLCNESYTSKTRSWDGVVHSNLGGAKSISDGDMRVDRDHNGARGIMLRALYGNLGHEHAARTA